MKTIVIIFSFIVVVGLISYVYFLPEPVNLIGVPAPTGYIPMATLPTSMKGYELYSWQDDGIWKFSLLTGTNRAKEKDEVKSAVDVTRVEDGWVQYSNEDQFTILEILKAVPHDTDVVWVGYLRPTQELITALSSAHTINGF